MSEESKKEIPAEILELLRRLSQASELYVLMSDCTKEPYVVCNPETFDDEIILFFDDKEAKQEAKRLAEEKIPVSPARLENKQLLLFFSSLYTMGVNALLVKRGGSEALIQLEDLVKRKDLSKLPDGNKWIENPSLHLTALYFAQEYRRPAGPEDSSRLEELQEEMTAHFGRGSFIFAIQQEGNATPMVKLKDELVYQPVFTDVLEFQKFNRENKFRPVVVAAENIPKVLSKESAGVILNLLGVNLPLLLKKHG